MLEQNIYYICRGVYVYKNNGNFSKFNTRMFPSVWMSKNHLSSETAYNYCRNGIACF